MKNNNGKNFRPDTSLMFNIFLIALAIFILGVQVGIKRGRELQIEETHARAAVLHYGYDFTD